jgi:hypothetical protein
MDGGNLMLNITLEGGIRDKLVVPEKRGQNNCNT